MEQAFQAAVEIGIPIVNCGPGGKSDDEEQSAADHQLAGETGGQGAERTA